MTHLAPRGRLLLCLGCIVAATLMDGGRFLHAAPATRPATAPSMDARVAAQLDRPVPDAAFADILFEDALNLLRDAGKLNIVVDWGALEEAGVDRKTVIRFRAKETKVGAALKDVTEAAGDEKDPVTYGVIGPVVFVSTAKGVAATAKSAAAVEVKVKGARFRAVPAQRVLPEVYFDGIALDDCADFLTDVSGIRIVVDWKALKAAGVEKPAVVHIRLNDVPFALALHLTLVTSTGGKADFTVIDRQIMITSAAAVANPPPPDPGL